MFSEFQLKLSRIQLTNTLKKVTLFHNIECIISVLNFNLINTRTVHNMEPIFNRVYFIKRYGSKVTNKSKNKKLSTFYPVLMVIYQIPLNNLKYNQLKKGYKVVPSFFTKIVHIFHQEILFIISNTVKTICTNKERHQKIIIGKKIVLIKTRQKNSYCMWWHRH